MHGRESPRPHQWTFQAHRPTSAPTPDPRKPTTGERGSTHPGTPTKNPDTPHTMTAAVSQVFFFLQVAGCFRRRSVGIRSHAFRVVALESGSDGGTRPTVPIFAPTPFAAGISARHTRAICSGNRGQSLTYGAHFSVTPPKSRSGVQSLTYAGRMVGQMPHLHLPPVCENGDSPRSRRHGHVLWH